MSAPYDLINPFGPTKPSSVMVVSTFIPALALIAVFARFNVRRMQNTARKFDDWMMIPASVLVIGISICGILGVQKKIWGYHAPQWREGQAAELNPQVVYEEKLLNAFQWIQIAALSSIKLGGPAFYKRVFCPHGTNGKSIFSVIVFISMVVVVLWCIGMILGNTFQCGTHVYALWSTVELYLQYCSISSPAFIQAFTVSNFVLDMWVILLPIPKIFSLQTTTGRKIAISSVFLLVSIGLAASIARVVFIIQLFHTQFNADVDFRLQDTLIIFWSNLEASVCLLGVNLPSLWAYRNAAPVAPSRIISSIRSALSLHSLRSNEQNSKDYPIRLEEISGQRSSNSLSSYTKVFPGSNTKSYAAFDVESQGQGNSTPRGAIKVESAVLQTRH